MNSGKRFPRLRSFLLEYFNEEIMKKTVKKIDKICDQYPKLFYSISFENKECSLPPAFVSISNFINDFKFPKLSLSICQSWKQSNICCVASTSSIWVSWRIQQALLKMEMKIWGKSTSKQHQQTMSHLKFELKRRLLRLEKCLHWTFLKIISIIKRQWRQNKIFLMLLWMPKGEVKNWGWGK